MSLPSITAHQLKSALIKQGIVTELSLISLLGENRHNLTLNKLELALVRAAVMSPERLLDLKAEVSGRPALRDGSAGVTALLDRRIALRHGALVLDRRPLTVAMVEDTPENVEAVRAAASGQPFDIWVMTAPQFKELHSNAYDNKEVDTRATPQCLFDLLDMAIRRRASDLYLGVGISPRVRVDGELEFLPVKPLDQVWLREQAEAIAQERHLQDLAAKFSADLAYTYGTHRFRVNIAHNVMGMTMALRKLPSKIPSPQEIDLPQAIVDFAYLERGLILITGPTGSGKSTTTAAVLDEIMRTSKRHIVTLEDPIEFRFPTTGDSLVNQRELGESFYSFPEGIRDALRQNPDVIFVGELRDAETADAALKAAESGHLCIGTLHTYDAASTVMRLVNYFDTGEQNAVRAQLSELLRGVVSQTLVPRASTKGRVAAHEIMVTTEAIAANLRKPDGHASIKQTMATSKGKGMQTMEYSLASLVHEGKISAKDARFRARNRDEYDKALATLRGQS